MTLRNLTPIHKGLMNDLHQKILENTFNDKTQLRGNVLICRLECINAF